MHNTVFKLINTQVEYGWRTFELKPVASYFHNHKYVILIYKFNSGTQQGLKVII